MTFEQAKATKTQIEAAVAVAGEVYNAFPKGAMGLTTDAVRVTPEFRAAKAAFDRAFVALRAHNGFMNKRFAKEMRQERLTRRAG